MFQCYLATHNDYNDILASQKSLIAFHNMIERPHLLRGVLNSINANEYWVARSQERFVGCARCALVTSDWNDGHWGMIDSVWVVPNARRSGVATTLLRHIENSGCANAGLFMFVKKDNLPALALWRKLGFGESPHYVELEKTCQP